MKAVAILLLLSLAPAGCVVVDDDSPRGRPVAVDPVCGAQVDPSMAWRGRYRGQEYYFHSDYCREAFYSHPEAYLGTPYPRSPYRRPPGQAIAYYVDPVCGRSVAATSPWWATYRKQRYYFHSDQCRRRFHSYPESYVGRTRNPAPPRYQTR